MNSEPSMISIQSIHDVFVAGEDVSGNIAKSNSIPLSSISLNIAKMEQQDIDKFKDAVKGIVIGSRSARNTSKPDPISALLMNVDLPEGSSPLTKSDYDIFEKSRIADKWRGNRIGELNELIACLLPNISKSSSGQLDLIIEQSGTPVAIAEVKNRFNTMNAASSIRTRQTMESLVLDQGSKYKGKDAILVERIPKHDGTPALFNPSDPKRGQKGSDSPQIVRMGLQQFLTKYGNDPYVYIESLILIAQVLSESGILPVDYDMRFIFKLLKQSLE